MLNGWHWKPPDIRVIVFHPVFDKGNIHNHLIYNSTSFADHKHFHSTSQSYYYTRRVSNRICREYGLSVIDPGKEKAKSYTEYTAEKNDTSWKAKLKQMIDEFIPKAQDFEDLLRLTQDNGYEVKHGKFISLRVRDRNGLQSLKLKHLVNDTHPKR